MDESGCSGGGSDVKEVDVDDNNMSASRNFTDRPFVLNRVTGETRPNIGFKTDGASYTIGDAVCSADMEKYGIDSIDMLRLYQYFDKINRRLQKPSDMSVEEFRRRESEVNGIRKKFNDEYSKLKQILVKTRYNYNMRKYVITPPNKQCTYDYKKYLRKLCKLDNMDGMKLQNQRPYESRYTYHRNSKNRTKRLVTATSKMAATATAAAAAATATETAVTSCSKASMKIIGGRTATAVGPINRQSLDDNILQKVWRLMNDADLVNKSIREQTQGGKSFLKQVVIPGKMLFCLYGKVLPDPSLSPDEISIPSGVMENLFGNVNMNDFTALTKRDPVFSSDAINTFSRVKRNRYQYTCIPSETVTNKQLDFDGDTISILFVSNRKCNIEVTTRLSSKIRMYCPFMRTRLSFSQTNPFRIRGLLEKVWNIVCNGNGGNNDGDMCSEILKSNDVELRRKLRLICNDCQASGEEKMRNVIGLLLGSMFVHVYDCKSNGDGVNNRIDMRFDETSWGRMRISEVLNDTLLVLSQSYGPFIAHGFVIRVKRWSLCEYNRDNIYPISDKPLEQLVNIAVSGSKGSIDLIERNIIGGGTHNSPSQSLEYAKIFIETKNAIRKQGHNAKRMDSALQNIIVNHDNHLVLKINNTIYDMGHVLDWIRTEWIMCDESVDYVMRENECDDMDDMREYCLGRLETDPNDGMFNYCYGNDNRGRWNDDDDDDGNDCGGRNCDYNSDDSNGCDDNVKCVGDARGNIGNANGKWNTKCRCKTSNTTTVKVTKYYEAQIRQHLH